MEKSLKYSLSCILIALLIISISCEEADYYQKTFTEEQNKSLVEYLINGRGFYYQGSPGEQMILEEANGIDPNNATISREFGVPYLKRGFAKDAFPYYKRASELDATLWQGYAAYCMLYFYRDYELALKYIDEYDALTPNFVDYPQSTSVNYMRGLCYYNLGQYDLAVKYLELHLEKDRKEFGDEYTDSAHYVHLAKAYHKVFKYQEAISILEKGLENSPSNADLWFALSETFLKMEDRAAAQRALTTAKEHFESGNFSARPYVEEFFQLYQGDFNRMQETLDYEVRG